MLLLSQLISYTFLVRILINRKFFLAEICKEDIITVGNYYNDLDMLQHAAVGIAVANAVDDVKKEADFVTEKNNNQDAVAEIITKMLNHDYDVVVEKCNE